MCAQHLHLHPIGLFLMVSTHTHTHITSRHTAPHPKQQHVVCAMGSAVVRVSIAPTQHIAATPRVLYIFILCICEHKVCQSKTSPTLRLNFFYSAPTAASFCFPPTTGGCGGRRNSLYVVVDASSRNIRAALKMIWRPYPLLQSQDGSRSRVKKR